MYTHLHKELEKLKTLSLKMASYVKESLKDCIYAFKNMDTDLAQQIVDGDEKINHLEVKIDETCLKLLALEGPVAKDLRFIIGCMRASIDLERIGDETANIAQTTIILSLKPKLPFYSELTHMGNKSLEMLEYALESFFKPDPVIAIDVCKMDSTVDKLNNNIIREIIAYMVKEIPAIERSVYCINIARRFERIGDLATNIAESGVFIAKGINIKHYCQFDNR